MTCIVAVENNGKIYMGGDSCGSDGHRYAIYGQTKVFKVTSGSENFLIGCTSSFRMIDLLTHELNVQRAHPDDEDDLFMRTNFIEGVRICLRNGGLSSIDSNVETGGNFLVGYNGRIYEIQNDFSVLNVPEWGTSVGSGEDAARGSLYTTRTEKDPKKRVTKALEAAEAVITSVRGPMYVKTLG